MTQLKRLKIGEKDVALNPKFGKVLHITTRSNTLQKLYASTSQLMIIQERVHKLWNDAQNYYMFVNKCPNIRFDKRGVIGGTACGSHELNFNQTFIVNHFEDYLNRTVPHEVAHCVAYARFGNAATPHGKIWKSIMAFFGVPATRCHNYDISVVSNRVPYKCSCKTYYYSKNYDRRAMSGEVFRCRKCGTIPVRSM